jgi:hypothetical protein
VNVQSVDGSTIATASVDGSFRLWDTATLELLHQENAGRNSNFGDRSTTWSQFRSIRRRRGWWLNEVRRDRRVRPHRSARCKMRGVVPDPRCGVAKFAADGPGRLSTSVSRACWTGPPPGQRTGVARLRRCNLLSTRVQHAPDNHFGSAYTIRTLRSYGDKGVRYRFERCSRLRIRRDPGIQAPNVLFDLWSVTRLL